MKRRVAGLPIVPFVALALGVGLLLLGSGWLFVVAARERSDALAQIPKNRAALELGATMELRRELDRQLATVDADIVAALDDPYRSTRDLVLVEDGRGVLPRRSGPADDGPARKALEALDAGRPVTEDSDAKTRVTLSQKVGESPAAFQAWLDHRAHFRLDVALDAASTLWAIEVLDRAGALDPARAQSLLRDGVPHPAGAVEALFARLLASASRLSPNDLDYVVERAATLARRYLVRVDDVLARVAELSAPDDAGEVIMGAGGRGRRVDLVAWRVAREDEWRAAGRIPPDGLLSVSLVGDPSVSIASATWDEEASVARDRFAMKAVGIGFVAVLAVIVFALAIVLQRRRTAYIELRSQLLRAVTHELKTPLASISALAQTLELRLGDAPQARDYPNRIVTTAERMGFLVDNILSFARLEGEAWKPQRAVVRLTEITDWLAGDPVARAVRPIDLELDVPSSISADVDPELVRLMLSNLVDNAAKYATAERVRVKVEARQDVRYVLLRVSDDGPGLGDIEPDTLFDDFRRGDVAHVRGTGLGLSICRWVAALHDGDIRVERTGPTGTTFLVRLGHGLRINFGPNTMATGETT